jgi:purine-binding chemotaxis protein CheW
MSRDREDQDILAARARILARRAEEPARDLPGLEVLAFTLAGEGWAIETRLVREVIRRAELTRVPAAPRGLAGVTPLRDELLPVVDLADLLGARRGEAAADPPVIAVGEGRAELGLLVDALGEIVALAPSALRAPDAVPPAARPLVCAVAPGPVLVLDGGALLADPRLFFGGP